MELLDNKLYLDDINYIVESNMQWERVSNSSFLIVGASSMIGRFMVDVLLMKKHQPGFQNMKIFCAGRDANKLRKMFNDNQELEYVEFDVAIKEQVDNAVQQIENIDYVVNLSSPAGSNAIKEIPVEIFNCNVLGTRNLLDVCKQKNATYVFSSSLDIYGNCTEHLDNFKEHQNGEIDSLGTRSCYFESKRMSETLCKCYNTEYGVNFLVLRFPKVFGPTMNEYSQNLIVNWLVKQCLDGDNPVIKSTGEQNYSFLYVSDLVYGMMKVILDGRMNEAYNISDVDCNAKIIDIANHICKHFNKSLVLDIDKNKVKFFEQGQSKTLDPSKIYGLGWKSRYSIYQAIDKMIELMIVR